MGERFINIKGFDKWHLRSRCQVLQQKHWELSLEIEVSKYISVFPLIFYYCSATVKALIKLAIAACKEPISTTIFFFSILTNCKK